MLLRLAHYAEESGRAEVDKNLEVSVVSHLRNILYHTVVGISVTIP